MTWWYKREWRHDNMLSGKTCQRMKAWHHDVQEYYNESILECFLMSNDSGHEENYANLKVTLNMKQVITDGPKNYGGFKYGIT